MFAHAELVEFEVFEFGDARQAQTVRAAFEREAVNHQQLGRALNRGGDGFNMTADTGKTTHFGRAHLVQPACESPNTPGRRAKPRLAVSEPAIPVHYLCGAQAAD